MFSNSGDPTFVTEARQLELNAISLWIKQKAAKYIGAQRNYIISD